MDTRSRFALACAAVWLLCLCACSGGGAQSAASGPLSLPESQAAARPFAPSQTLSAPEEAPASQAGFASGEVSGEVIISFDYEKIPGSASNQYAVWIEDADGRLVRTLYATRWTAQGGYQTRPDAIALWVEKSALATMPAAEVDAVAGATPQPGTQTYAWDLKDASGRAALPGEYRYFVEGTLRWKNYVLHSGEIIIGGAGDAPTAGEAEAQYVYEASARGEALTEDAPENAMIGPVTARFVPGG